jgi:hypothetical protein
MVSNVFLAFTLSFLHGANEFDFSWSNICILLKVRISNTSQINKALGTPVKFFHGFAKLLFFHCNKSTKAKCPPRMG